MAIERVRRVGRYAPLSSAYYHDDAIGEAFEQDMLTEILFTRGLAYSAGNDHDGFMSTMQLVRFVGVGLPDPIGLAEILVKVGTWLAVEGGYQVRTWTKWNKTAEEISGYRGRDAARKRRDSTTPPDDNGPPRGARKDASRTPRGDVDTLRAESDRNPTSRSSAVHKQCSTDTDLAAQRGVETAPSIASLPRQDEIVVAEIAEPTTTVAVAAENAGTILAAWIDYCTAGGVTLPKRLKGHYATEIKKLTDEGIAPELIKRALASMLADSVADKPSYLANRIVAAQTGPERRRRLTASEESTVRLITDDPGVAQVLADWFPEEAA